MFRTNFKGVGSLKAFVVEVMKIARALNDAEVRVPADVGHATMAIEGDRLLLDLSGLTLKEPDENEEKDILTTEDLENAGSGTALPSTTGKSEEMVLKLNYDAELDLVADWGFQRLVAPPVV